MTPDSFGSFQAARQAAGGHVAEGCYGCFMLLASSFDCPGPSNRTSRH